MKLNPTARLFHSEESLGCRVILSFVHRTNEWAQMEILFSHGHWYIHYFQNEVKQHCKMKHREVRFPFDKQSIMCLYRIVKLITGFMLSQLLLKKKKKKGTTCSTIGASDHACSTPSMKPFRQLTYSYIKILWVQVPLVMFEKYHPKSIDFCTNFCIFQQTGNEYSLHF